MARTDIHRPSAPEFDPEAYTLIDVFDLNDTEPHGSAQDFQDAVRDIEAEGFRRADNEVWGCGHCGQTIRYAALLTHPTSGEWIIVGQDCLSNRFTDVTKAQFQELRKLAQLDRERQLKLKAFRELCDANPSLAYATYLGNVYTSVEATYGEAARYSGLDWGVSVGSDIARKARQYGEASFAQLGLVERIVTEQEDKLFRFEARQAERAEAAAERAAREIAPLTAGRQTLVGKIISRKEVDTDYGMAYKLLIELDGGARVYGTEPSSLYVEVGDRVQLDAKVEPKEADFGFYSRPTKASKLEAAGE